MSEGKTALIALLWLVLSPIAAAQDNEADKARLAERLDAVRAEIETIRQRLDQALGERDLALDALAESERAVSDAERARRQTLDDLERTSQDIERLDNEIAELELSIGASALALANQLALAYRQGGQSRLKLLLNQDDPRQINRHLAYHGYLSRQRLNLIDTLRSTALALAESRSELEQRQIELGVLDQSQQANLARLESAREQREAALVEVEKRVQTRQQQLAELEQDERELAALLDQLAASLADIPPEADVPSMADLRGRLPHPLAGGKPLHRFGERRAGELVWNGWLVPAPVGTDVKAVGYGRVAFADWLRGYGLILIIDHGDGFMSLYAHNEALLRDVGDWVSPGDVVASAGNSGGVAESGLYFELRRNGEPINPGAWLSE